MGKYKIKAKELRKLSNEELIKKISEWRMELINLKSKVINRLPIKETKKIREIRRNIARALTILRERGIKL